MVREADLADRWSARGPLRRHVQQLQSSRNGARRGGIPGPDGPLGPGNIRKDLLRPHLHLEGPAEGSPPRSRSINRRALSVRGRGRADRRSEEHTSELQSRENLVCRLLLEKKKELRTPLRT